MTFLKAKRCLTFNFMSIMKPSDHVRFWEAFVFHSTIDLKSYNRKNSVAIVTNNQRELQNLYDNIRFSIYFLISLSSCCQIQIVSLYKVYYLHIQVYDLYIRHWKSPKRKFGIFGCLSYTHNGNTCYKLYIRYVRSKCIRTILQYQLPVYNTN